MEAIMEPVSAPGRINGAEVINDLLDRIGEQLSKSCDLRGTDSYLSYAATVTINLQLTDFDTVQVVADLVVGTLSSQPPPQRIVLTVPPVTAEQVQERLGQESAPSLERCVDGSFPEPHPIAQPNLERCTDGSTPQGAADGGMLQPRTATAATSGKRYYTPRGATPGSRSRSLSDVYPSDATK